MLKRNHDIRAAIKSANISTWQVAERMGIHENTFYRMLRKELQEQKKKEIYAIIEELKEETDKEFKEVAE